MSTRKYRGKGTQRRKAGNRRGIIAAGLSRLLFFITVLFVTLTGAGEQGRGARI